MQSILSFAVRHKKTSSLIFIMIKLFLLDNLLIIIIFNKIYKIIFSMIDEFWEEIYYIFKI